MRELDCRSGSGLQVRLLWCEHDDTLWVSVIDFRSGKSFRVPVDTAERASEVFRHPFAYGDGSPAVPAAESSVALEGWPVEATAHSAADTGC